jgi:hypothetical protein
MSGQTLGLGIFRKHLRGTSLIRIALEPDIMKVLNELTHCRIRQKDKPQ